MTAEPITDVGALRRAVQRGYRPQYLMFWGHRPQRAGAVGKECLSQWWPCSFAIEDQAYASAEHFMMAEKARLFGDEEARAAILKAASPSDAKQLGRSVRAFDEGRWSAARFDIIVRGNVAKFGQNPPLRAFLSTTEDRVLVEASPTDRIWGIGLAADDPGAQSPETWRGLNLLGFALMEARRILGAAAETARAAPRDI
jgi:ribA/ribD-fused uncharacterized protein